MRELIWDYLEVMVELSMAIAIGISTGLLIFMAVAAVVGLLSGVATVIIKIFEPSPNKKGPKYE